MRMEGHERYIPSLNSGDSSRAEVTSRKRAGDDNWGAQASSWTSPQLAATGGPPAYRRRSLRPSERAGVWFTRDATKGKGGSVHMAGKNRGHD